MSDLLHTVSNCSSVGILAGQHSASYLTGLLRVQNVVTEVLPSYIVTLGWMLTPILHSLNHVLRDRLAARFGPLLTGVTEQYEGFLLKF